MGSNYSMDVVSILQDKKVLVMNNGDSWTTM